MRKFLILIVLQIFVVGMWANNDNLIIFDHIMNGDYNMENQVPITGNIRDNNLNLEYKGGDVANVYVKDHNGSIVYQNSINGKNTINLGGYAQGNYTVKVEDTKGNSAVAQFQVTK